MIHCERHGTVNFHLGNNMEFLRQAKEDLKFQYWHIAIVDPPYGINIGDRMLGAATAEKHRERKYKMGEWDKEVPTQEYWDLLSYCCRNIICWGGNYFTKELNWSGRCYIVWDKKADKLDFAPCELALTTFDENAHIIRYSRSNKSRFDGERRHPTQKPEYIYDYIYVNFVKRGWRVLDTHGGSMSHAVAANKNGVNLDIIEIDEDYYREGIDHFKSIQEMPRLLF